MMTRNAPVLVPLLAVTLCLGACSAGRSNSSRSASAVPSASTSTLAEPTVVTGKGYTITLPKGWVHGSGKGNQDLSAYDSMVRKTSLGITVTTTELSGETSVTKVAAWTEKALKDGKGEQVKEGKLVRLGGKPARSFTAILPSTGDRKVRTVRLVTEHQKRAYVVSVAGPADKTPDEVLQLNKEVLSSWAWKK